MSEVVKDQPPPSRGQARPTWELLIEEYGDAFPSLVADMEERHRLGVERYGVAHQHDNGRDHVVDALQELLDGAVYLRAEIAAQDAAPAMPAWDMDYLRYALGSTMSHANALRFYIDKRGAK